jgi:small subunit ribosomal protein S19
MIMAKIETFRGKTAEEIAAMGKEEGLALLTSRARRAVLRAGSKNLRFKQFIKHVNGIKKTNPDKVIKTQARDAVILPEWVGLKFSVHSGKEFKPLTITIDKIGYRLGDFAHSTGRVLHSGPGVGATRGSKFIPLK